MKTFDIQAPTAQGPALKSERAFLIVIDFHEAGLRAAEDRPDPDRRIISAICPMIVCYAFSAELYLKSLWLESDPPHKHTIHTLFGRLPRLPRKLIADLYKGRTGRSQSALDADLRDFKLAHSEGRSNI